MDEPRRIIDLTPVTTIGADDYIAMDSEDGGTKKIKAAYFTDGSSNYMWGAIQGDLNDQLDLKDALNEKANIDGYYEDMSVGSAEQLLSDIYETDTAPYNFRTSGGALEIGDRETDKIIGVSVPWNQIEPLDANKYAKVGASLSLNDTEYTLTSQISAGNPKYASISLTPNHVWLIKGQVKSASGYTRIGIMDASYNNIISINGSENNEYVFGEIIHKVENGQMFVIRMNNSSENNAVGYAKNINLIDLTTIFGDNIADYIYSLESSNAGVGVSYIKSYGYCIKDYYAKDEGTLKSSKPTAHKMVGFNQWNEEWEVGGIDAGTGANVPADDIIRSKDYIKVLPNTTYYVDNTKVYNIYRYDYNNQYIGSYIVGGVSPIFTTPQSCYYIRFRCYSSYGTTYKDDICINFHWDGERDGEYEEYKERTYSLDSTKEWRGILKLDANNKLYSDGDIYESDGTGTRRYGILTNQTGAIGDTITLTGAKPDLTDIVTSAGHLADVGTISGTTLTLTKALSAADIVYELATPTTESAEPYTNPQWVDNWGTEEYVDTREVPIPAGHTTEYLPNLKAKVEVAPDSPDVDGDYIMHRENGENAYSLLTKELPTLPSEDGTYVLKATVSGGVATLSWVAEE